MPERKPVAGVTHHILVVDDNPGIRSMVAMALDLAGYVVTTAANGAEALREIERSRPSVMLLDMQMPELDGWGLAERLRELGQWVPTVVMTAEWNAPRLCAEIGADACLGKPFEIDQLLTVVDRLRPPAAPRED